MRRFLVVITVFLALGGVAQAQAAQPPYTTANKLAFNAPDNATTQATANALSYTLTIDGQAAGTVANVACVGAAVPIPCTAPLTATWVAALNVLGKHDVTIIPASGSVVGPASAPFVASAAPTAPTGLLIK